MFEKACVLTKCYCLHLKIMTEFQLNKQKYIRSLNHYIYFFYSNMELPVGVFRLKGCDVGHMVWLFFDCLNEFSTL